MSFLYLIRNSCLVYVHGCKDPLEREWCSTLLLCQFDINKTSPWTSVYLNIMTTNNFLNVLNGSNLRFDQTVYLRYYKMSLLAISHMHHCSTSPRLLMCSVTQTYVYMDRHAITYLQKRPWYYTLYIEAFS